MKIQLSDHFTFGKLLRFTLPSVGMMVFTSLYGIVDGYFVSNFVGKTPFAAVNFIMPVLMIFSSFGSLLGAGGSALISKTLGEGKRDLAASYFSLFVYITLIGAVVFGGAGFLLMPNIAEALGAGEMLDDCVRYGRIILLGLPAWMLQYEFQSFFVVAERPNLGFAFTVASGVANMILDAVLVGALGLGVTGAAVASVVGQAIGGILPIGYFLWNRTSTLRLVGFRFYGRALLQASYNGMSEFLSNVSMSVVGVFYNLQLVRYLGENGVAAYGTLMYVSFIFFSVFIGYSVGTAPIIGYSYGAQTHAELANIYRKSLAIILATSGSMLLLSEVLAAPLTNLYVGYDAELCALTLRAFRIFSFSFLFSGIAIFGSSFFTALNNGFLSALISSLRTIVFQVATVFLLPLLFGPDGIWYSLVVAELLSASIAVFLLLKERKRYHYGKAMTR